MYLLPYRSEEWALVILPHTTLVPPRSAPWNSFYTLPLCPGAMGSGTSSALCLRALGY